MLKYKGRRSGGSTTVYTYMHNDNKSDIHKKCIKQENAKQKLPKTVR